MELVKEVTEGARVASEKGENRRRGRRRKKKQDMALKEKRDMAILRWRKSPRHGLKVRQSSCQLITSHSLLSAGVGPCSCQGGLL